MHTQDADRLTLFMSVEISLTRVIWTLDTFENKFAITNRFIKYLEDVCEFDFNQHFFFKYFLKV